MIKLSFYDLRYEIKPLQYKIKLYKKLLRYFIYLNFYDIRLNPPFTIYDP